MQRGEVWWARLPEPIGRRPVVPLSRPEAFAKRASVTVGIVTRTIRGIAPEAYLDKADGMPSPYVANLDDILTINKASLEWRITELTPEKSR